MLACWLCVLFFFKGDDENFTKSRDYTQTPPSYSSALPGHTDNTLHPPTTISGLPRPDQPLFIFFITIIIIIIFLVRFLGPSLLPTNTAQPFLGKERKKK